MKRLISLFTIMALLSGLSAQSVFAELVQDYSDLDLNDVHAPAIQYTSMNVFDGYDDGSFRAEDSVNRAELAKILVEGSGESPSVDEYSNCFTDVATEWFAPYVCYGAEQGWWDGYSDGSFGPANGVLKVEAAKMLWTSQGLGTPSSSDLQYVDLDSGQWYMSYLEYLAAKNFLEESGLYYTPGAEMNRGEIAEMLFRFLSTADTEQETYSSDVYEDAMEKSGLDEYSLEGGVLIIAESYTANGNKITVDSYSVDEDGLLDLGSHMDEQVAVICEGIDPEADPLTVDTADCFMEDERYSLRELDGITSLAILGYGTSDYSTGEGAETETTVDGEDFFLDEDSDWVPDWAEDELLAEDILEYLDLIEEQGSDASTTDTTDTTTDPITSTTDTTVDPDDYTHCAYYEDELGHVTCEEEDYYGWVSYNYFYNKSYDDVEIYGDEPEYYSLREEEEENIMFTVRLRRIRVEYSGELSMDVFYLIDMEAYGEYYYDYVSTTDWMGETTDWKYEQLGPVTHSQEGSGFDESYIVSQVDIETGEYRLSPNFRLASMMCTVADEYYEYNGEGETNAEDVCFQSGFSISGYAHSIDSALSGSDYTAPEGDVSQGVYSKTIEWNITPVGESMDPPYMSGSGDGALSPDEWEAWGEASLYEMQNNR